MMTFQNGLSVKTGEKEVRIFLPGCLCWGTILRAQVNKLRDPVDCTVLQSHLKHGGRMYTGMIALPEPRHRSCMHVIFMFLVCKCLFTGYWQINLVTGDGRIGNVNTTSFSCSWNQNKPRRCMGSKHAIAHVYISTLLIRPCSRTLYLHCDPDPPLRRGRPRRSKSM